MGRGSLGCAVAADAESRNRYEAIWEGLGDSLDRVKAQSSITKVSGFVWVTMCR